MSAGCLPSVLLKLLLEGRGCFSLTSGQATDDGSAAFQSGDRLQVHLGSFLHIGARRNILLASSGRSGEAATGFRLLEGLVLFGGTFSMCPMHLRRKRLVA